MDGESGVVGEIKRERKGEKNTKRWRKKAFNEVSIPNKTVI